MIIEFTKGEKIGLIGIVITLLGAFLPWATWGTFSVAGTDGDGVITLIFGIIVGALILLRSWDTKNMIIATLLGILTLLIGIYDASNIANITTAPLGTEVEIGIGLYFTIIGGGIMLISGLLGLFSERNQK